jgi:hypothetical protein
VYPIGQAHTSGLAHCSVRAAPSKHPGTQGNSGQSIAYRRTRVARMLHRLITVLTDRSTERETCMYIGGGLLVVILLIIILILIF